MKLIGLARKSTGSKVYVNIDRVTHIDSAGADENSGTNIWFNGDTIWVRESVETVMYRMAGYDGSN